jgi:hypothetical protein
VWRNPKYPAPAPPAQRGEVLAVLRRGRGEELRVVLDEYEGNPYLCLRVWAPCPDGRLMPVRGKGCSVRLREAEAVAEALVRGVELAEDGDARPPQRSKAPTRSRSSAEAFGEFGGGR